MSKTLRPIMSAYDNRRNDPDEIPDGMTSRTLTLRLESDGKPSTIDEATRSIGVICATENPVEVVDWERWEIIPEVLLMSGCQIPENRQVPLLDTHRRNNVASVFGSCRALKVENDTLVGRAHYSEDDDADRAWKKTQEGHLIDYSIGYRVLEHYYIPEGEKQIIEGRTFEGPVKVATKWKVRELSTCPIGADEMAKARAITAKNKPAKENDMNERLRKFLESRGLAKNATDEEAWRFLSGLQTRNEVGDLPEGLSASDLQRSAGQATPTLTQADVERLANDKVRAEIERRDEIRSMCDHFGMRDMATELISNGSTLDAARQMVIKKQMEQQPETPAVRAQVVADERDKFRAAATDALIIRSGNIIETPAAGAHDLTGYSLREMAREALRISGQSVAGNALEMVGRSLTTSDFPIILSNLANKSLFAGWDDAEETWDQWCDTGSVNDFKTHTSARIGEMDDLDEVGENAEYKYGSRAEAKEEYKIATYGKLFAISRQTIINDDLGALTNVPRAHGEAAARKIGDVAYAVLIANGAMGDGTALFHSTHGNIGTAGAVGEATTAKAIELMKLQKDLSGKRRLNIQPRYFIAPVALEGSAEVFFGSNQFAVANTAATRANPYAGGRFARVYEPRLDDASATTYYFAGPKGKTVRVFFLGGNQRPYMEMKQGWNVDGVEYKVRIDAGAKAMDWRGLVRTATA